MRDASPAEPEVSGGLRDGTDRALSEAGGDLTARSPPVSPHYSHITPHCGCTCTLLTAVCLWQGATRRELRGRTQTGLVHMHRCGGRGGESWHFARMCRARQPGRVDRTG